MLVSFSAQSHREDTNSAGTDMPGHRAGQVGVCELVRVPNARRRRRIDIGGKLNVAEVKCCSPPIAAVVQS